MGKGNVGGLEPGGVTASFFRGAPPEAFEELCEFFAPLDALKSVTCGLSDSWALNVIQVFLFRVCWIGGCSTGLINKSKYCSS